jgi:hypothetical protein
MIPTRRMISLRRIAAFGGSIALSLNRTLGGATRQLRGSSNRSKGDTPVVTTENFLRFWAKAIPSLQIHPDDAHALNGNRHLLALDTLVGPFMGPVRTAPVVLLTLNGGFNGIERHEATIPAVREAMARNLHGDAPLPSFATNPLRREWTERRLAQFGLSYEAAASNVAFVNLIPYRSTEELRT